MHPTQDPLSKTSIIYYPWPRAESSCRYSLHTRPSHALVYTFTDWASDSLLLMPPRPSPSPSSSRLTIPQPVYHISVSLNLNPFLPISYTTTIRHGGDAQGPFVGSFEYVRVIRITPAVRGAYCSVIRMSLSQMRAIVTIGDITTRLSRILSSVNGSLVRLDGFPLLQSCLP